MELYNIKFSKQTILQLSGMMLFIGSILTGCEKMVEIDSPIQSVTAHDVYNTDATAASVLTGIYINMSSPGIFSGQSSISLCMGLSADELIPVTPQTNILTILYSNALSTNDQGFWLNLYTYIFKVNSAIEGISTSTGITSSVKHQLLGEAKFLRAFYYFYLVNIYGDVPLLTSTDIKINSKPSRSEKEKIYLQIIQDLKDAEEGLNNNYVLSDAITSTTERTRPNKNAAMALLSRVYLYTQQWAMAEAKATELISNTSMYGLETLNTAFLSISKEAIWQLQPVGIGFMNTNDGLTFVLATNGISAGPDPNNKPVYLSNNIFNNFEIGDNRRVNWIDSVSVSAITYLYAFKYKEYLPSAPRTEYLMVLRLSEQYLIRAEARAQLGKITGTGSAGEDLNVIRNRAGLSNTTANTQNNMLNAILQERKVELFTEWGHRWLDLKRTNKIDEVMNAVTPMKGGTWSSYKALYPIPITDIQRNPNLKGHQNPGYPEQ